MVEDIIIITGKINSGKSSRAKDFAGRLRAAGKITGGIITLPFWRADKKSYYIIDLMTGEGRLFASEVPLSPSLKYRRFYFSTPAFTFAEDAAEGAFGADYLFIDEPGPLELEGRGLAAIVTRCIELFSGTLVLVVREKILDEIVDRFAIPRERLAVYGPDRELPV